MTVPINHTINIIHLVWNVICAGTVPYISLETNAWKKKSNKADKMMKVLFKAGG